MNHELNDMLYASPSQFGEYRIIETVAKAKLIQCAQLQHNRLGWFVAPLLDVYAETAYAAHRLANNHVRNRFQPGALLPEQFVHLTSNLAVKQHKLNPMGTAHQACELALSTMSQLACLSFSDCTSCLIDAGLISSTSYVAQAQEALVLWARMGTGNLSAVSAMLGASDKPALFHQRLTDLLISSPNLIPHYTQLDNRTLTLLKRAATDTNASTTARWLQHWFVSHDSVSGLTNLQNLEQRLDQDDDPMEQFTISLSTAVMSDGCGSLKVKTEMTTVDQASLASIIVSSYITKGAAELVNGAMLPVFRSSKAAPAVKPDTSSLVAITIHSIEGAKPTPTTLQRFCDLFLLDFDYSARHVALDDPIYA